MSSKRRRSPVITYDVTLHLHRNLVFLRSRAPICSAILGTDSQKAITWASFTRWLVRRSSRDFYGSWPHQNSSPFQQKLDTRRAHTQKDFLGGGIERSFLIRWKER
ncbi:hypothetical protein CEXT_448131 [Caerostris extrusa]|uniref:Uncharacterized protein n=1 Tax=Caerostris extrusa TaxID=172846 RepID=A0AAV4XUN2_CAEEX|nr:hypothetical protein CEXT_448131 [Caerostris extrusa]